MPINALRRRWNEGVVADNAYDKQSGDAGGGYTWQERRQLKSGDDEGVTNEQMGSILEQVYGDASEETFKKAVKEYDLSDLNPQRQKNFLYEKLQEKIRQDRENSAERVW